MKKQIIFLDKIHSQLKEIGEEKSASELFAWSMKHNDKLEEAFDKEYTQKYTDGAQAKCLKDHAGECGLCSNGVFLPCN